MCEILVVDDSPIERTVIAAILNKRFPDSKVSVAVGGAEALALMELRPFDLILTDLMMPEITGLELVQEIRSRALDVAVILMTGYGNEETAINALLAGATSYVPKRELDLHLLPTVENVLSVSKSRRSTAQLLSCMTETLMSFTIGNDDSLISPLIAHIQDQIRCMRTLQEPDTVRLGVALHEALSNAILHGNLECSSDLRQEDESIFHQLAKERRQQTPFSLRTVQISARLSASEVRITVRDQGRGFDVRREMDPDRPIDLERIGGRGLLLMRSFMDVVYHNATGNEITLIKFAPVIQSKESDNSEPCQSTENLAIPLTGLSRMSQILQSC